MAILKRRRRPELVEGPCAVRRLVARVIQYAKPLTRQDSSTPRTIVRSVQNDGVPAKIKHAKLGVILRLAEESLAIAHFNVTRIYNMVLRIILSLIFQLLFTVGIIVVFGFIISLCNKIFYANFGSRAKKVCYITGFIGTPVHELSHALFCVIFCHKIKEIKLFQINSADGTLGYVNHTYNKRNLYQRVGNFFIGVAPIIVITLLMYLFAYLLIPDFCAEAAGFATNVSAGDVYSVLRGAAGVFTSFFSHIASWQWWVFFIIGATLSLHMTLSRADMRGAASGVVFLVILFAAADIICAFVSQSALTRTTRAVMSFGCGMLCFFVTALIISLLCVCVSFVFRLVFNKR